ncbi:MAG: hypothetical protein CVT49_10630 [candidate division Zixibacteria bacterium HGW-Zixibacteria-1]|nr:MAG: hypothetical protein CVT49_10630 [candidate division Zixibacteria bacterium HGW-Zixibacteria-1]
MNIFDRMMSLDRRWVFLFLAIVCVITYLWDFAVPITISNEVKTIYNRFESLEEGDMIYLSVDYDPNALAELHPTTYVIAEMCFRKKVKVIFGTLSNLGQGMVDQVIKDITDSVSHDATYNDVFYKGREIVNGIDYVFLGYKPYPAMVIQAMGLDFRVPFPTDYYSTPIDSIPMMKGVKNFDQCKLVLDMAAGNVAEMWITYGHGNYGVPLALAVTGVMGADMYPYLGSGQIFGLAAGLLGSAQIEKLCDNPGRAIDGMRIQVFAHILIILFILMGNVGYLATRNRRKLR